MYLGSCLPPREGKGRRKRGEGERRTGRETTGERGGNQGDGILRVPTFSFLLSLQTIFPCDWGCVHTCGVHQLEGTSQGEAQHTGGKTEFTLTL